MGKFGYHAHLIRLSHCLDDLKAQGLLSTALVSEPEFERIWSHMDAGDELRGLRVPLAHGMLAAAAMAKIAAERKRNPAGHTMPMPRHAWLISSLKNPAEVELLRRVYGAGFFLVGLSATESERRLVLERGMSSRDASRLTVTEMLGQLEEMVAEALPGTRLRDITEYGRAVHAEMSALTSAARLGISVRGATLYCTTFPCHNCAKHIAASGIARVVFVEPYAKSKARDLHADSIELVGEPAEDQHKAALTVSSASERTKFEPFLGVGPRRYFDLFSMRLGTGRSVKRKDSAGNAIPFEPCEASPRIPLASATYLEDELVAADMLETAKHQRGTST